jgi:molybdate transport system substrate-binding protein
MAIQVLSGGAAKTLVNSVATSFSDATGARVLAEYSAVGAIRLRVLAEETADMIILSRKVIDELIVSGFADPGSAIDLGQVMTGLATCTGNADACCNSADSLRLTLLDADGIFFPDPDKATAGIHFASVLDDLGIRVEIADRIHTYPDGFDAINAMVESGCSRPIGCTQVTEILGVSNARLIGPLPHGYALTTTYTAAVLNCATEPYLARKLISALTSPENQSIREQAGFSN